MKLVFLCMFTIASSQNMEIFEPDFLRNFNPLRIYRDPFQFDDSSSDSSMENVPNIEFNMPKYIDRMTGLDDGPRDSISYAPAWFKM